MRNYSTAPVISESTVTAPTSDEPHVFGYVLSTSEVIRATRVTGSKVRSVYPRRRRRDDPEAVPRPPAKNTSLSEFAIAGLYRGLLVETLASARAWATDVTLATASIEKAFTSRIPKALPRDIVSAPDSPELRRHLRSNAAKLIIGICDGLAAPRSEFVSSVIEAARARKDGR